MHGAYHPRAVAGGAAVARFLKTASARAAPRPFSLHRQHAACPGARAQAGPLGAGVVTLEAAEREAIQRALHDAGGKVGGDAGAAAKLGMKRTTLQAKMRKLGIDTNRSETRP